MNQLLLLPSDATLLSEEEEIYSIGPGERLYHIQQVLKPAPGDFLRVVLPNRGQGMAKILSLSKKQVTLHFILSSLQVTKIHPWCHLWMSYCRPLTAKKVFEHATCMGVGSYHVFPTEKSDPSFAQSHLYQLSYAQKYMDDGLSQSRHYFHRPELYHHRSFTEALSLLQDRKKDNGPHSRIIVLSTQSSQRFHDLGPFHEKEDIHLVVGPERDFSGREYEELLSYFPGVLLTQTTLRVEMAVFFALAQLSLLLKK